MVDLVDKIDISKGGRKNPLKMLFDKIWGYKENLNKKTKNNPKQEIRIGGEYLCEILDECLEIETILKKKPLSISEIYRWSQNILKAMSIVTIRDTKEMWKYDEDIKKYVPDAETYIQSLCSDNETGGERCTPDVLKKLMMHLQGNTFKTRKEFESQPGYINMKNGVYCLKDRKLYEHDPKYFFTYVLPYNYEPSADCPTYKKVVENLFPEKEDRITIKRWCGYQFMPGYLFTKYLHLFGPSGAGKSTLMHGFYTMLGQENYASYEMKDFLDKGTYATANIYKKLANICADMSTATVDDMTMIKRLVSAVDVITARDIYRRPFQYVNPTKLTFVSNLLPFVKTKILTDDAIKRRAMILGVYKADFQANEEIFDEIKNEASGIFNWAMEGYLELIKEKNFGYNKDPMMIWAANMDYPDDANANDVINATGVGSAKPGSTLDDFFNRINKKDKDNEKI